MTERAFTKEEQTVFQVNTGDTELQMQAQRLIAVLSLQHDIAEIGGVLFVALQEVLLLVLHMESPMPEMNIQAMENLIETLKENLAEHYDCHIHATEYRKAAESDEPPSEPEEPKVN